MACTRVHMNDRGQATNSSVYTSVMGAAAGSGQLRVLVSDRYMEDNSLLGSMVV